MHLLQRTALCLLVLTLLALPGRPLTAQTVTIDTSPEGRQQGIDGFGAHQGSSDRDQTWWQELFYDDMGASIYRVDLTPRFVAPYSDFSYYSPWFMGSGTDSPLNLEDPDNPDGPEGNRVRTYTGVDDYSRPFGGQQAPIAVMGPDIEANVALFDYASNGAVTAGASRREQLGDFKLIGSFWSPAPWVKVSSGNTYAQNWWPGPVEGAPWPFIWGGNFAGGMLDVSGTPLDAFDDSALGGTGPTSALTQFARSTAAYILGYQRTFDVAFYAISIQNELNFEQFYNSATYPLSSMYIAAVKAVKAEFENHPELQDILIMGPEDLLGGDAYGMWQYGGGDDVTHKNLQYLQHIAADPDAAAAVDFFCIHGYDSDGVSAAGGDPTLWRWWAEGWINSPAEGIPGDVAGFLSYGKKSWMTETSGEQAAWLAPADGFPNQGGWSIAPKIHQALTTGRQSAWVYWTFSESDDNGDVTAEALTNATLLDQSPKYVAAKHFFRYIRPGAVRLTTTVEGSTSMLASAYLHDADETLTVVLINSAPEPQTAMLAVPEAFSTFDAYTSSEGLYWQASTIAASDGQAAVTVPGYGVTTLYGARAPTTGREEPDAAAPSMPHLAAPYPNPVRDRASLSYTLPEAGPVTLSVYDLLGRRVAVLVDAARAPGTHAVTLDAAALPPGLYVYRLQAGAVQTHRTFVRVRE